MSITRIRIRRGTTTQWNASTKILQAGELGLDTTLNKIKTGNGAGLWSTLPDINVLPSELTELAQDAVESAITAGTGITKNYNDIANTITLAVDNTIANKTYVDAALAGLGSTLPVTYIPLGLMGQADGVATLDENGKIPDSEIPTAIARLSSPTFTGTVSGVTKAHVGLADVDNTADTAKPVSTAAQTALDLKAPLASPTFTGTVTLPAGTVTSANLTWSYYSAEGDLPAAGSNHGMFAHVHSTGAAYYAHAGSWFKLAKQEDVVTVTINSQSSNYTIVSTDAGKLIEMSAGGTLTITDSASFSVGFTCDILQTGASQVTVAGTSFTPNATPGLKLRTQWSSATLIKRALNSWVVLGDLSA